MGKGKFWGSKRTGMWIMCFLLSSNSGFRKSALWTCENRETVCRAVSPHLKNWMSSLSASKYIFVLVLIFVLQFKCHIEWFTEVCSQRQNKVLKFWLRCMNFLLRIVIPNKWIYFSKSGFWPGVGVFLFRETPIPDKYFLKILLVHYCTPFITRI